MNTFNIFTLWQKSNMHGEQGVGEKSLSTKEFFKPRIRKNSLGLKINIYIYLLMQLAGIMISCYDISLFISNPKMLVIICLFILLFTTSFIYGITVLFKLKKSEFDTRDMMSSIKSRIKLYKINFEVWLWLCSATVILLPMAIVFIPDSVNGTYVINNVTRFVVGESIIFAGIYLLNKLAVFRAASDLRTYYSDLLEGSREKTESRENYFRKYRTIIIAFFLLLMLILVFLAFKGLIEYNNFK